jgi:hypothetical protein
MMSWSRVQAVLRAEPRATPDKELEFITDHLGNFKGEVPTSARRHPVLLPLCGEGAAHVHATSPELHQCHDCLGRAVAPGLAPSDRQCAHLHAGKLPDAHMFVLDALLLAVRFAHQVWQQGSLSLTNVPAVHHHG